jgi:hypothetical protein
MNPHKRQQERARQVITELEQVMAEADAAIAQAERFFAGEGAAIKRHLDQLSTSAKAKIDAEVALMMRDVEQEAERAFRHKMFEQSLSYRPRNARRLV